MKGILNLYKPRGISSAAAISSVKRIFGTRAVGHMGTLDPMAEGVLLVGIGKATRLFDFFLGKDKVYKTDFTFGYATDTLDSEGRVMKSGGIIPTAEQINAVLGSFLGEQAQLPPQYCAKSVDGVRAYTLARKGIEVALKPAKISIYSLALIEANPPTFTFRLHCSSGTYVRSVCRDLAERLGSHATMTSLVRIACDRYNIQDSVTPERLSKILNEALIPIERVLDRLVRYDLSVQYNRALDNGGKLELTDLPQNDFVLYCDDTLYGIAENDNGRLRIKTYLKD